ncbi:MAG: hypothetical protein IPP55_14610 [Anaerolineales bacterium]|nr:hypothetical protein [Anaerolineales bacterium]
MSNKNKVEVTVKGQRNKSIVIGGNSGTTSQGDSENEVKVNLSGKDNQLKVTGGDSVKNALEELSDVLMSNLKDKNDKDYVREIIQQLQEQVSVVKVERNEPKIKGLLSNLSTYVGLAGIAVSQAEKIKSLYEQVINFFS